MIDPFSLTVGPLGPRVVNLFIGIGGIIALSYRRKLLWWQWLSFIGFAYYLHETITQGIEWAVRYFQGFQSTVLNVLWTNLTGGGFELAAAFIMIGWVAFRKRFTFTPYIFAFMGANLVWLAFGYPTSPAIYKTLPSDTGVLTNVFEECYTATFMLLLWKSFR